MDEGFPGFGSKRSKLPHNGETFERIQYYARDRKGVVEYLLSTPGCPQPVARPRSVEICQHRESACTTGVTSSKHIPKGLAFVFPPRWDDCSESLSILGWLFHLLGPSPIQVISRLPMGISLASIPRYPPQPPMAGFTVNRASEPANRELRETERGQGMCQ